MAARSPAPRRIHGVDFSGARNAGRLIWVASGAATGRGLAIEACRPAAELLGGGRARAEGLAALRGFIAVERDAVFGLDVPFGLPWPLVRQHRSWEAFVRAFRARHPTAEDFRAACRAADGGRELRRETDRAAATPFSPYNLRMYRQTYHALRDLLAPLLAERAVCVPPMQPLVPGRAWLLEICPAATLKKLGLYLPYKGRSPDLAAMRAKILKALEAEAPLTVPAGLRERIVADRGGDALDSVVAARTAFRLTRDGAAALLASVPPEHAARAALEAWVFH